MAEGIEDLVMEPFIVTHVGRENEVKLRIDNGQEFMYVLGAKAGI